MRKIALISIVLLGLLAVAAAPSEAWHGYHYHSRVFIGVGPVYAPYPYWYDPYYYPRYVYTPPPVVIQQEPPVYVQRPELAPPPAPPPPPAAAAAENYWYYCPSAKGYYPNVASCPEPWVKVPPRP